MCLAGAAAAVPVGREPGLLAVTEPVASRPRHVCHTPTITFRPDPAGGLVLAHAADLDRTIAADTPADPPPPACGELLARATAFRPDLAEGRIIAARIGVRPMPADGLTIAGPLPGFANFHVAVTHSGVTLGPLLGRLVAGEVCTGRPAAELAPFRPDRFVGTASA